MAYKKYIKKDGKLYGPYIYSSKRVDGKVVSEYHGIKEKKDFKKFLFIGGGVLILLILIFFLFFFKSRVSSNVILDLSGSYSSGKISDGVLRLSLKQGELIPDSAKIILENNGSTYEYFLKDLISEESVSGNYYVRGTDISGEGSGYGLVGEEKIYPDVYFRLNVYSENISELNESDSTGGSSSEEIIENNNSEIIEENNSEEIISETENIEEENVEQESSETVEQENVVEETSVNENANTEETQAIVEESSSSEVSSDTSTEVSSENSVSEVSSSSENSESSSEGSVETSSESSASESSNSAITGAVIGGFFQRIFRANPTGQVSSDLIEEEIQGDVSYEREFKYSLVDGEDVEIIEGSVKTDTKELSSNVLNIEKNGNEITITTNYYESQNGFGEGYLGNENKELIVNLNDLGIEFAEGDLKVSVVYSDEEIISLNTKLEENATFENEEIIGNFTEEILNETNETIFEENITNKTVSVFILNNVSLTEPEREILNKNFPNSSISSERSFYKDWILVDFNLENYHVQYSYDSSLNESLLEDLIENDRINWLKDIANSLSYEEEVPVSWENSSKEYEI
ncbi:MAG: hypothetical protein WC812_01020 [Candidatus Pacearchaeota archaeon]|jgi:hypothetical protein